jgi:hypothetical protein
MRNQTAASLSQEHQAQIDQILTELRRLEREAQADRDEIRAQLIRNRDAIRVNENAIRANYEAIGVGFGRRRAATTQEIAGLALVTLFFVAVMLWMGRGRKLISP